jgi:hypothetical protein
LADGLRLLCQELLAWLLQLCELVLDRLDQLGLGEIPLAIFPDAEPVVDFSRPQTDQLASATILRQYLLDDHARLAGAALMDSQDQKLAVAVAALLVHLPHLHGVPLDEEPLMGPEQLLLCGEDVHPVPLPHGGKDGRDLGIETGHVKTPLGGF